MTEKKAKDLRMGDIFTGVRVIKKLRFTRESSKVGYSDIFDQDDLLEVE